MSDSITGQYFSTVFQKTILLFSGLKHIHETILSVGSVKIELLFSHPEVQEILSGPFMHIIDSSSVLQQDNFSNRIADTDVRSNYNIMIWDSSKSGVAMPEAPYSMSQTHYQGELKELHDNRYSAAYSVHSGVLFLADHERRLGIVALSDKSRLDLTELAAPFRMMMTWVLARQHHPMVHAAAVGDENGAVLITGASGSGKSSTSLQCLTDGMKFLGDDLCPISVASNMPLVHSLYATVKCKPQDAEYFPILKPILTYNPSSFEEKCVFPLIPAFEANLVKSLPIKAILIPTFKTELFGFEKQSAGQIVHALASEAMARFDASKPLIFKVISEVVRITPIWRFHLGKDRNKIADAIHCLLQGNIDGLMLSSETNN